MLTPSLVKTPLPHHASSVLKSHPAITPMAFVQAIVRAYEARQMSALGALEKAQIPPNLIDDADEGAEFR